jgi:hypothetical protein
MTYVDAAVLYLVYAVVALLAGVRTKLQSKIPLFPLRAGHAIHFFSGLGRWKFCKLIIHTQIDK